MKPPRTGQSIRLYRAFYQEFEDDPLPSRSALGRFHDSTTDRATSYLAGSSETAWKEVTHRWRADNRVYRMAEVDVKLSEIVDLTEPSVQERYGVDQEELTADDYQVCQQLADRLRAEGVEAIWTYSRADQPGGRQLVVFVDRLKEGSLFEVASIRAIE